MKRYSRSNMKKSKLQNTYCLILVFALKMLVGARKICEGIQVELFILFKCQGLELWGKFTFPIDYGVDAFCTLYISVMFEFSFIRNMYYLRCNQKNKKCKKMKLKKMSPKSIFVKKEVREKYYLVI